MVKVITYGTFDLMHYGHIKLLERAKALGDYLIVGVTADDFDKKRGKINVKQSLIERIEAVKALNIADEIIIEEYEGQKIDDILRNEIDIFTVGSDWEGKFDYLNEYCKVVYLPRTEGISSSALRTVQSAVKVGMVGSIDDLKKFVDACSCVNGVELVGLCTDDAERGKETFNGLTVVTQNYLELLEVVDAVYLISHPEKHYEQIKQALNNKKHVLCQTPITLKKEKCTELFELADKNNCILMEAVKTAYSTAYSRLLLLIKSGVIGKIVSVDAVCTSKKEIPTQNCEKEYKEWNSICSWGGIAMLPVFQLLGTKYNEKRIISNIVDKKSKYDLFTKINFIYSDAIASIFVGSGIKSEGALIITGTDGYVYVPAPWWKMDYFEIRYENPQNNKRYFYDLESEGRKYEVVAFVRAIESGKAGSYIKRDISLEISNVLEDFYTGKDVIEL